jgi:hypothetical protein
LLAISRENGQHNAHTHYTLVLTGFSANLGFTPINSKNGHTYAFQFQCLSKGTTLGLTHADQMLTQFLGTTGSPITAGAAEAHGKRSEAIQADARVQTPLLAPPAPSSGPATCILAAPPNAATKASRAIAAGPIPGKTVQANIGFSATKRKASPEPNISSSVTNKGREVAKKQRRLSQESFDGASRVIHPPQPMAQAGPEAVGGATDKPPTRRRAQSDGVPEQPVSFIDLTLSDDDTPEPRMASVMSSVKPENLEEAEEDMEDLRLQLRQVELQRKLHALTKKSRQAKVESIKVKEEQN